MDVIETTSYTLVIVNVVDTLCAYRKCRLNGLRKTYFGIRTSLSDALVRKYIVPVRAFYVVRNLQLRRALSSGITNNQTERLTL